MRKFLQSRVFTATLSSLATATLVACLCLRGHAPSTLAERIAKMEAELKSMQEEAAKNPARPTVAQMEQELERMAKERRIATR